MTEPKLILHHFPGACSRVSLCALDMAGLDHEVRLVDIAKGLQTAPEHLAKSPLGKVPVLEIDGVPLLENSAILVFIDALRPEAGLLPLRSSARQRAEAIGGLSFCGGNLHPTIRGLANPQRVTTGDGEPVRERSRELLKKAFGYAEQRLAANRWWLGDRTIVDIYLDWTVSVARNAGFDFAPYPLLDGLRDRLDPLPAYRHMLERDAAFRAQLGL